MLISRRCMSLIIHPLTHRPDLDCRRYSTNVISVCSYLASLCAHRYSVSAFDTNVVYLNVIIFFKSLRRLRR